MNNTVENAIQQEEKYDSFIVERIYQQLKGQNFYFKNYPQFSYCDCYSEISQNNKRYKWNTEIKQSKQDFPNFLLKVDKLQRMRRFTAKDCGLYLIYLNCDNKAYIYNCNTLDWSQIPHKLIRQKKCQLDPNSEYEYIDTYIIPKDMAKAVIDYTKIKNEWYAYIIQAKKEGSSKTI